VGLERVTQSLLRALPELRVISKYGVGVDNIDFNAMADHKVLFGYSPGVNKRGVAELALQMMLILLRRSYQANLSLRGGKWVPLFGNNLSEKTVGILGLGHVGKDLVTLLKPFGCRVLCHDIRPDRAFMDHHGLTHVGLVDLFAQSEIVSIHVPLNRSTRNMVNEDLLKRLRENAILINTARGGIVDESVLYQRLVDQKLFAAASDVFEVEPCQKTELLNLPSFFGTPHIGGSSTESVLKMGEAAITGLESARPVHEYEFLKDPTL
jgi:D-3-phosphoglycerate dehydrogenase